MSQPDLLRELREARPLAPAELRAHVRRLAADAAPSPAQAPSGRQRRLTWRRLLLVAVPVAAVAAAGGAVLLSSSTPPARQTLHGAAPVLAAGIGVGPAARSTPLAQATPGASSNLATVPAPNPNRAQRITTTLELRVASAQAVSDDTKQVVRIAQSLGGYPSLLVVNAAGRSGYAESPCESRRSICRRRSPGSRRSAPSSAST